MQDPTTERSIGYVPEGTGADADTAVTAAVPSQAMWSQSSRADRAILLRRLAAGIGQRREELVDAIVMEVGTPRRDALLYQVRPAIDSLRIFADLIEAQPQEEVLGPGIIVREPIGVATLITPWNFPLSQLTGKVGAALAAGCAVVCKPSEVAPISAFLFAEIVDAAEIPAGVFNLVSGLGTIVGEALVEDPRVDMVSFTGSVRAGRRVSQLAGRTLKAVTVELGGKCPNLILDDKDLKLVVARGIKDAFLNNGQTCNAMTRMLVPAPLLDVVLDIARSSVEQLRVGDPWNSTTDIGPLVSERQRQQVNTYIRKGTQEGAQLLNAGDQHDRTPSPGYFVPPTVFYGVAPDMIIAQEEIFGPVLSILTFNGDEDAIRIANNSRYGLAAQVWSGDPSRAESVARCLRVGQVTINGSPGSWELPFGGYKQSGHGRERGRFGIDEFLSVKALRISADRRQKTLASEIRDPSERAWP